jgi:hypothetical protein
MNERRIQLDCCDDGRLCVFVEEFKGGKWERVDSLRGDMAFLNRLLSTYRIGPRRAV